MRSVGLPLSMIVLATVFAAVACTPPVPEVGDGSSADTSDSTDSKKSTAKKSTTSKTPTTSDGTTSGDDDDNTTTKGAPTTTTTATASTKFACSGAGIAAFADALVNAGRQSCTNEGTGVVKNDNYQCVKTAIDQVAPPNPDKSYEIVTTLLAPNQDFPNLECTYFIQMVTAGVCGTPLSPSDMKWQDYPLAKEFIGKAPAGWTWMQNDGSNQVQLGDIFVYNGENSQDPGHIMIVAEMKGSNFRIAEANELNADGSAATDETGVMSNSRVTSLNDPDRTPVGWFRLAGK
jgi:hypothetical protein